MAIGTNTTAMPTMKDILRTGIGVPVGVLAVLAMVDARRWEQRAKVAESENAVWRRDLSIVVEQQNRAEKAMDEAMRACGNR